MRTVAYIDSPRGFVTLNEDHGRLLWSCDNGNLCQLANEYYRPGDVNENDGNPVAIATQRLAKALRGKSHVSIPVNLSRGSDAAVYESARLLEAGQHAPKGGATINGKEFKGGQFIPGADLENATPQELKTLGEKKEAQQKGSAAPPADDTPKDAGLPIEQPGKKPPTKAIKILYRTAINKLGDQSLSEKDRKFYEKQISDIESKFDVDESRVRPLADKHGNKLLFAGASFGGEHEMSPDDLEAFKHAWFMVNDPSRDATHNEVEEQKDTLDAFREKYGDATIDALEDHLQKRLDGPDDDELDKYKQAYYRKVFDNELDGDADVMAELEDTYGHDAFQSEIDEIDEKKQKYDDGPDSDVIDEFKQAYKDGDTDTMQKLKDQYQDGAFDDAESDAQSEMDEEAESIDLDDLEGEGQGDTSYTNKSINNSLELIEDQVPGDVLDHFRTEYMNIDSDVRDELNEYQGTSFAELNRRLRDGEKLYVAQQHMHDKLVEGIKAAGEFPEPITTWRGKGSSAKFDLVPKFKKCLETGSIFRTRQFDSQSANKHTGENFGSSLLLKIKCKSGLFGNTGETEIIHAPGTGYKVLKINEPQNYGPTIVELEQVDNGEADDNYQAPPKESTFKQRRDDTIHTASDLGFKVDDITPDQKTVSLKKGGALVDVTFDEDGSVSHWAAADDAAKQDEDPLTSLTQYLHDHEDAGKKSAVTDASDAAAPTAASKQTEFNHNEIDNSDATQLHDMKQAWLPEFPEGQRRKYANEALSPSKYDKVIVLRDEVGAVRGVASCWKEPGSESSVLEMPQGQYIRIRNMATTEAGQGYGRKLIDILVKDAAAQDAGLSADAAPDTEGFYEKLGFHRAAGAQYYLTADEVKARAGGMA